MLHLRVLVLDVCVTVHTSLVSRAGTAVHARTLCVCALVPDACHGTHCLVSTRGYSDVAMTTLTKIAGIRRVSLPLLVPVLSPAFV